MLIYKIISAVLMHSLFDGIISNLPKSKPILADSTLFLKTKSFFLTMIIEYKKYVVLVLQIDKQLINICIS